jgi:ketosteroid isomerase-like protein
MEASSDIRQRNVELARRSMEAYNQGDIAAVIELLAPDVVIYTPPTLVNAGTYRGHAGFARWIQNWEEAWESFEIEVSEVEPLGDGFVLVDAHQVGTGRGSGVPVELAVTYAFGVRDGRITYLAVYPEHDQAATDAPERGGST